MTRILSAVILLAVALPALAAEPAQQQMPIPPGYVVVNYPDGTWEALPPEIAAKQIEADAKIAAAKAETSRVLADSEALRVRNETPAQPYYAEQVDDESTALLGGNTVFSTQPDDCLAIATSKARKAKLEVVGDVLVRCREIAVRQKRADNEGLLAQAALEGKEIQPITVVNPEGGGISTGQLPATVRAATATPGGLGGVGGAGYGIPFGGPNPAFTGVQTNALGWQAIAASQLGTQVVVTQPTPAPAPTEKVVVRERVVTPQPTLTPEEAEIAAAKLAIERAKQAAD